MAATTENGPVAPRRRPIRIANCSGASVDPAFHMFNQTKYGNADAITGDYLAEVNLASNAEAMKSRGHPGWDSLALDGISLSLELLNEKRIKVIVNGGALNPKGLAHEVEKMVTEKGLDLKVAYVLGDDFQGRVAETLEQYHEHLDGNNPKIQPSTNTSDFLGNPTMPIVSANAYLGARAIRRGLEEGADIIICGRVSDASPVIGCAQWWFGWSDTAYDELAGSLIAGHLIECSTYATGANFAGFYEYELEELIDLGLPIVEIESTGECTVTKAETLRGIVNEDVIKSQLLYELQGNIYLNSDVTADVTDIVIENISKNRVHVRGVRGYPPPPTTKLAVFYRGGYQSEFTVNATGYATAKKWDLQEAQVRYRLQKLGVLDSMDVLEFQRVGVPQENPKSQLAATSYLRIFAQSRDKAALGQVLQAWADFSMQHFSGMHCSIKMLDAMPSPFLVFFPCIIPQSIISETINFVSPSRVEVDLSLPAGHPPRYLTVAPRENYEPTNPITLSSFGPTTLRPLGDIALARSGDKGANLNIGIFVHTDDEWNWLRSFMTRDQMVSLIGDDWKPEYFVERVEFPHIKAVHFVIYGLLGRGVSSSTRLDQLGKGFADFVRFVHVAIPDRFFSK